MFIAYFIAANLCLHQPQKVEKPCAKIVQVTKIEQPDLIKWNLQYFHDAIQRDDRRDMEKFAARSISLLKQHKEYAAYLRTSNKDEYFKLMNLRKVIPPILKVETPIEKGAVCKDCSPQKIYQPARRYKIPGQQIHRRRDNLPGNR
jgi:hypothetical protein